MGIVQTAPAFGSFTVKPRIGSLTSASLTVPSPSNTYRDRIYKTLEMTGVYHTILKFSELGHDIYLTEQVLECRCARAAVGGAVPRQMHR